MGVFCLDRYTAIIRKAWGDDVLKIVMPEIEVGDTIFRDS